MLAMADEVLFTPFCVDRAKTGRAGCKGCKGKCQAGELRLGKVVPSPYGENQQMKSWYHVNCLLNALLKQRPATKRIDSIDDIGDWHALTKEDQEYLLKEINSMEKQYEEKNNGKYKAKVLKNESSKSPAKATTSTPKTPNKQKHSPETGQTSPKSNNDDKFDQFTKLCQRIASVDAYLQKTATVNTYFSKGTDKTSFKGDLNLWCKFLLPQVNKRVYNLKSKQLTKIFSRILVADQDEMLTHLEKGDVAETIVQFFKSSHMFKPAEESTLSLQEVETFLENLSKLTKEDEQIYHFKTIIKKCTLDDIKSIIRLIKGDLRINAGPKHILEAVHPDAYNVFQTSRDLDMVLDRIKSQNSHKSVDARLELMTPVLPMLAEACKSVEMAMAKCPHGMFAEVKYDGERVQVHKQGNEFRYFSRALKPVQAHKVWALRDHIPRAFPSGGDLVLDAEVLMVDLHTGKPLPFGTLGVHKRTEFKDAQVCLYVFDCLYYNGRVLLDEPVKTRRRILEDSMTEVKNHVMLSEQKLVTSPGDLASMIAEVLQQGLEGLVLKDVRLPYEPGKRHWLKVKKDYLFDGAMADTADLLVLGAWYGTGKKGGKMSVFLMGCHDQNRDKWVTVTKVHTGHDDKTLDRLQTELEPLMVKISQEFELVPSWLLCTRGLVPDFVAKDPKSMPVWEITGTEFTQANIHTADGISVRFPRVTRIRSDKNYKTATNLEELKHLYKTSKEKTDVTLLNKLAEKANSEALIKNKNTSPASKNSASSSECDSPVKRKTIGKDGASTSKDIQSASKKRRPEISDEETQLPKKKIKKDTPNHKTLDEYFNKNKKAQSNDGGELKPTEIQKSPVKESTTDRKKKRHHSDENERSESKHKKMKNESLFSLGSENDCDPEKSKKNEKLKIETAKTAKETLKGDRKKRSIEHSVSPSSSKESKAPKKADKTEIDDLADTEVDTPLDPKELERQKAEFKSIVETILLDIFKDFKMAFYPNPESFDETIKFDIERHWFGYGGEVVNYKYADVDFMVHLNEVISYQKVKRLKKYIPCYTRHVHFSWVIKCINNKELCDTTGYNVTVVP